VTHGLQDYLASAAIPTDGWTHVAAVLDRWADVHFYVDGALVSTVHGALPATDASGSLWVGDGVGPWQGALRDLRLYDGELSADEVRQLADMGGDSGDTAPPVDSGDSSPLPPDSEPPSDTGTPPDPEGCGCGAAAPMGALLALLGLAVAARRRVRERAQPGACGRSSGS
jgi:MYXO-CTERM domain-containing protein